MDADLRHVALLVPAGNHYVRQVCQGLATYARHKSSWHVWRAHVRRRDELGELMPDGVDGAIAMFGGGSCEEALLAEGVPVVNVVAGAHRPGLATVAPDNAQVGRLAGRCFLDRGLRRFAYVGMSSPDNASRQSSFTRCVLEAGGDCRVFEAADVFTPRARGAAVARLAERLGALARPAGVLAFSDVLGRVVTDAAAAAGLQVPDDVGVLGVDNWEIECEFSRPRLASVDLGLLRVGHEAGALLDRLMAGEAAPDAPLLLPPAGVVERPSADVSGVGDPMVRKAVRVIRDRAVDGLDVEAVCEAVGASRSWLDAAFRERLGCTVHEEIWRVRVSVATSLLVETDWPLSDVAVRSGFSGLAHLSRTIRKRTGETPTEYRRRHRNGAVSPPGGLPGA